MSRKSRLAIAMLLPGALLTLATAAPAWSQTVDPTASLPHGSFFQHMLKKLDTDGDGRISQAEFLAAAAARFKTIDTQGSGSFTAAQLAASPRALQRNERFANVLVKRIDTAKQGYITQDEYLAQAKTRFAKLDKKGDGKLTVDEFTPVHFPRVGAQVPEHEHADRHGGKHAQEMFARLDTNGDGVVTLDEYLATATAQFKALDTQGTGKVTAADIAGSPKALERDKMIAAHVVKKLDTNGDGMVSQDEYLAAAKARFSKIDKNGDGFIDADEIVPHHWAHNKATSPTS